MESCSHEQKAAQPADEHGDPEPSRPHGCRPGQEGNRIQRGKADKGGNEDDRQSPALLAYKIKKLVAGRPQAGPSRPDWALFSHVTPMLDKRKLLALPYAKKEQQL